MHACVLVPIYDDKEMLVYEELPPSRKKILKALMYLFPYRCYLQLLIASDCCSVHSSVELNCSVANRRLLSFT